MKKSRNPRGNFAKSFETIEVRLQNGGEISHFENFESKIRKEEWENQREYERPREETY